MLQITIYHPPTPNYYPQTTNCFIVKNMDLKALLTPPKTIAVVGISDKPDRPSYLVTKYLLGQGFTILPVNPMIPSVFGIPSYPSITAIPQTITIDIVDIFRKSSEVPAIIEELISAKRTPLVWMQEGVVSDEGKVLAEKHVMDVIMDRCMMKESMRIH